MAILRPTKTNTKTVSFRLPAEIVDDFDTAKSEAKKAGFTFDLTDQIEKLITLSVKQARAELAGTQAPDAGT